MLTALLVFGLILELAGLILTARGLLRSWRASSNGERFAPRLRALWERARRLLGRPPHGKTISVDIDDLIVTADSIAVATVTRPNETVADRFARVEAELAALWRRFRIAERETDRRFAVSKSEVRTDIDTATTTLAREIDDAAVFQLRPAIWGLGLAVFGVFVQTVAIVWGAPA